MASSLGRQGEIAHIDDKSTFDARLPALQRTSAGEPKPLDIDCTARLACRARYLRTVTGDRWPRAIRSTQSVLVGVRTGAAPV
jgi:hypothetical protein